MKLFPRKLSALLTALWCASAVHAATKVALDQPTHKEIEPIRIPLGNEGHLKTIAMDRRGNLLVGVSWLPEGAPPSPKREPLGNHCHPRQ
jgi:hypothetical protein